MRREVKTNTSRYTQLLVILLLGALMGATQQTEPPQKTWEHRIWVRQRAEQLIEAAEKVIHRRYISPEDERAYFDAFPESFTLLNVLFDTTYSKVYGCIDIFISSARPDAWLPELFQVSKALKAQGYYTLSDRDLLKAFFNLRTIDRDEFYNRLIDIGSEGAWDADFITFFQGYLFIAVEEDLERVCRLLAARSDKVVQGFWFFCLDEPHPRKETFERLQGVQQIDKRVYQLMQAALAEVHKHACSGH